MCKKMKYFILHLRECATGIKQSFLASVWQIKVDKAQSSVWLINRSIILKCGGGGGGKGEKLKQSIIHLILFALLGTSTSNNFRSGFK